MHSDSFNEHLIYAQRIDGMGEPPHSTSSGIGGGGGGENPQEAAVDPLPSDGSRDEDTFVKQYLSRIITAVLALALIGAVFVLLPYNAVHAAKNDKWNETLYWSAGAFVLVAVPVSAYGIVQHLVNYYMPQVQKVSDDSLLHPVVLVDTRLSLTL